MQTTHQRPQRLCTSIRRGWNSSNLARYSMPKSAVRSDGQTQGEWARHWGVIRRLYMDEDMTLQEVMKILASEYGFVASYDSHSLRNVAAKLIVISVKSYKKRLRDHNCRKNIRSSKSDAEAFQHLLASSQHPAPAHVKLSNGRKWLRTIHY